MSEEWKKVISDFKELSIIKNQFTIMSQSSVPTENFNAINALMVNYDDAIESFGSAKTLYCNCVFWP